MTTHEIECLIAERDELRRRVVDTTVFLRGVIATSPCNDDSIEGMADRIAASVARNALSLLGAKP